MQQGHAAAARYSWMSPPSTSRRCTCRDWVRIESWSRPSGTASARPRCGRWRLQGRPGARCPPLDEPVSPDRPPNPACQSSRHRALHEARHQTKRLRCRSAPQYPTWTARSGRRYSPAAPALPTRRRSLAVPLRPVHAARVLGLLRALRHDPPPPADDAPARRTKAGRAATGRFPRSPPPGRRGRCPAILRQPRQGYAAALPPGLPDRPLPAGCGVARRRRGGRALLTGPHPPGSGPARRLRSLTRWFLAYTFSSCLPDPGRLAVPARPGVVRAAPTLACVSTLRLPSASPACCDRPAAGPFHPRPVVVAPRGAGSGRRTR